MLELACQIKKIVGGKEYIVERKSSEITVLFLLKPKKLGNPAQNTEVEYYANKQFYSF